MLADLIDTGRHLITQQGLTFCLILVFVSYFLLGVKEELSKNAARNTAATLLLFGANIMAVGWFVQDINHFFQDLYASFNIPTLPADFWDAVPYWLVCLIAIITKDFSDYWAHRAMHTKWGWPAHAAHHSDSHVNAFTAYRVHFMQAICMNLFHLVLLTWLQMPEVIPVLILVFSIHVKYVHMNVDWEHGPFWWMVASPAYHRWHHADLPEAYGKNIANLIPLWDVLFGTYYYPGKCPKDAPMGALKSGVSDTNLFHIYAYPFLEWGRLIGEAMTGKPMSTQYHKDVDEQPAPDAKRAEIPAE